MEPLENIALKGKESRGHRCIQYVYYRVTLMTMQLEQGAQQGVFPCY